jgi:hypothetical protein
MRPSSFILAVVCLTAFGATAAPSLSAQNDANAIVDSAPSFKERMASFHGKLKRQIKSLGGSKSEAVEPTVKDAPVNHFHFDQRRIDPSAGTRDRSRYQEPSYRDAGNRPAARQTPNGEPIAQANYEEAGLLPPARLLTPENTIPYPQQHQLPQQQLHDQHYGVAPGYPGLQGGHQHGLFQNGQNFQNGMHSSPMPAGSTANYSMPNQNRAAMPSQQTVDYGNYPAPHLQHPQQPPAQQHPAQQSPEQIYAADVAGQNSPDMARQNSPLSPQRTGHFQNGYSRVQTLAEQRQMTASQRVLQLQSENKALMEQRDAMIAENKRLNAIIAENQKLLGQADTAIAASVKQLELANRNNQILKQRIVTLQSENESQMAESKRMLDSIRQRLDDVLIREISSK